MEKVILKDVINNYINYVSLYVKPTTRLNIDRNIKKHILPYLNKNIYEINNHDIIQWQNMIKKLGYSNSFNNNVYCILQDLLNYLHLNYKIEKITINRKVLKSYKIINKEKEIWNIKDFKKFINVIDNYMYKVLFITLFKTGLRKGELLALTFNDIDKYSINVNKTITKELFNGKRLIMNPKTTNSVRNIQIDFILYHQIMNLKKIYIKKYGSFKKDYYIFGGIKPIATTTLDRYKNKYCDQAHVKRIGIHAIRHSHATLLYNHNVDIKTIQHRLGHSNINTTLNIYIHCDKKNEKRVIKTLFQIF